MGTLFQGLIGHEVSKYAILRHTICASQQRSVLSQCNEFKNNAEISTKLNGEASSCNSIIKCNEVAGHSEVTKCFCYPSPLLLG